MPTGTPRQQRVGETSFSFIQSERHMASSRLAKAMASSEKLRFSPADSPRLKGDRFCGETPPGGLELGASSKERKGSKRVFAAWVELWEARFSSSPMASCTLLQRRWPSAGAAADFAEALSLARFKAMLNSGSAAFSQLGGGGGGGCQGSAA